MVFKRRDKLPWVETLRSYILPRAGWRRTLTYMGHRLKRLPDSPTRIARGVSFGVFISFSPLFGFHIILALVMARFMRANMIAAVAGTAIGNPFTFPIIVGAALKLGNFMLGRDPRVHDFSRVGHAFREAFHSIGQSIKALFGFGKSELAGLSGFFFDVLLPYALGGAVLGLAFAIPAFYITKPLIIAYQKLRRKNLAKKARKRSAKG